MNSIPQSFIVRLARSSKNFRVWHDQDRSLLSVEHDGTITWDELQAIKNDVWGPATCAVEVYPPKNRVVNNAVMRHLWRLGPDDWWPDLGYEGDPEYRTLRERFFRGVS